MEIVNMTNFPSPTQIAWSEKFLAIAVPNLIHGTLAMQKKMPANQGYILRMSRTNRLANAMVPLGPSGITPPPSTMSRVDIDVRPQFFGDHMLLNEQCTLLNTDPVMNQAVEILGIQMRTTEDALTRNVLASTAGAINCTGGGNGDNPTDISRADVGNITKILLGNNCKTIGSMIESQNKFGVSSVRNSYFAMAHTDLSNQLENVDGFTHSSNYPSQTNILESEWGAVGNIRYLLSSEGSKDINASGMGATVYNMLVAGMEAYAVVKQDRYTAKFINKCVNYKSSLIDLETLTHVCVGNRAQAAIAAA